MSFTAEVKEELSRIDSQRGCCRKSELSALIRIEGTLHITGPGRFRLEVATETAPVARKAIKLLDRAIELDPSDHESIRHKGLAYSNLGREKSAMEWFARAVAINQAVQAEGPPGTSTVRAVVATAPIPGRRTASFSPLSSGASPEQSLISTSAWAGRDPSRHLVRGPSTSPP